MINKLQILIADDDPTQLDHLKDLIMDMHPNAEDYISLKTCDNKNTALGLIRDHYYDFVISDLSFNDEDNPGKIDDDGLEIIKAAAKKSTMTRIFLWSNKKFSDIAHQAEEILKGIPVEFKSLPKDISLTSERFRNRYFLRELKEWTRNALAQVFQRSKNDFIKAFNENDHSKAFTINGEQKGLSLIKSYWFIMNIEPKLSDLVEMAPKNTYDLPNIESERLFGKPYTKFKSNLSSYYIKFFDNHKDKLDKNVLSMAKDLLDGIVIFYSHKKEQTHLHIENTKDYPNDLLEVCNRISESKLALTAVLKSSDESAGIDQFIERLWCRIVVLGMYIYLKLPITDCYYILAYKKPTPKKVQHNTFELDHKDITFPDKEVLNYFKRFLWIYSLTQNKNSSNRNLKEIFTSLSLYEQQFLENWWSELKSKEALNTPEIRSLIEFRSLDENYHRIHES